MTRYRQKVIYSLLFLVAFFAILLSYRDDFREIPDRWHAPFLNPEPASSLRSPTDIFTADAADTSDEHPIDHLIRNADLQTNRLERSRAYNVSTAAAAYRQSRGRHPPPAFDAWVEYPLSHDCIIVEDLFDQIYRDLEPFWGLKPNSIRDAAGTLPNTIRIRSGKVQGMNADWSFVSAYFDMLKQIEGFLPDIDLPVNEMDESRVLLSWEDVNDLVAHSTESKNLDNLPTITSFEHLDDRVRPEPQHSWLREGPYWDIARKGCPPESLARNAVQDADFSTIPEFPSAWPAHTYHGFVANWTIAKDPCVHAHLRNLHGSFVEPISQFTTNELLPMFGGSKLPFNNDILLPAAVYWNEDDRFSAGNTRVAWSKKRTEVVWRGSASGGRNTRVNWTRFQRHRLLSMLNGTQVQMALKARDETTKADIPHNFPLPNQHLYHLQSVAQELLPDWLRSLSNAAFTWLVCFPATQEFGCDYTGSWYRQGGDMPMSRMFHAKYLPDVDGNSFSGRYRAFLKSNSLPIKATIYSEWHDDRLVAWKHFVPMDNTFMDLWAILEYFVSHDAAAEKIAREGREWADKVLRKEDMLAYVYRLVLEYARVSSDERDSMGWVPVEATV